MNIGFWNKRYQEDGYAYGLEPNDFLKSKYHEFKPNSKTLCIAEGEGRNALYLAKQKHHVTALDFSEEGLKKLNDLALREKLDVQTICIDLNDYHIKPNTWDAFVCIFGHFPTPLRTSVFKQVYAGLKTKGIFIMEAYHKDQLNYKTGGPQIAELLYSKEELKTDFSEFRNISIETSVREIEEGTYHKGTSAVIQVIGKK